MRRRVAFVIASLGITLAIGAPTGAAVDGGALHDLQALIDAASPGDLIEVDPGIYRGGVVIDKPIRLEGRDRPIIDAGGEGNAIDIEAPGVTVSGFVIRNTGNSIDRENAAFSVNAPDATITNNILEDVLFGIFLRGATDSVVADNVVGAKNLDIARRGDGIRLWESHRTTITGNTVSQGRDVVLWFSDDLEITNNTVSYGRYGLHFMYSDNATVARNDLIGNSVGTFLMYGRDLVVTDNTFAENNGPSGYGLGLKDMDGVTAVDNRFVANRVGVYLDNSPWSYDLWQSFTHNLFAYNEIGVQFLPSVKRNAFSENAFIDNGEQVGVQGTGQFSGNEWAIDGVGNYWSDFSGYDADRDGIGDIPYKLDDLYSEMADDHPELRFFSNTPAARAVDQAALMFPVLRPRPKVEDPSPLVSMPAFEAPGGSERAGGAVLALVSAAMLAVGLLIVTAGTAKSRRSTRSRAT